MYQIHTISKLQKLPIALRRDISFYAPLVDSLDFMGVDPVTFTRASTSTAIRRDGLSHAVAANQPRFEYSGDLPLGLKLTSGETLTFNVLNELGDADTLIWFETGVPKSTPTNTNPFSGGGAWAGNLNIHLKEIVKARRVLANSEIAAIQTALGDVAQVIIPPPPPPVNDIGTFVTEIPAHLGGGVYELSQNPNLNSLLVAAHGGLFLRRVASSPGNLEFTASGTGNKTLTLGLAPSPTTNITAQYVTQ